jgi:ABC-type transporter Mla subunit MlaD
MKKEARNEVAVGVTVTIALLLAIYIVVMLADWPSLFAHQQKITVRMPYKIGLRGLTKGSLVYLGGFKIGQIIDTGIGKLDPESIDSNDVYVFFTMKIPQQYHLRRDCVLVSQSNMLGGQVMLAIEDLGIDGELIKDGQTVDLLLADTVIEALKHEFDPDNPESLFSKMKKDIPAITEQILHILDKVDKALETAQSAIANIEEYTSDERIDKIMDNLNEISVNLKLTTREVRRAPWKLLYKPGPREFKIQSLVDSAGAFAAGAENLDSTALRLQKLAEKADSEVQSDRDRMEAMIQELQTSFDRFREAEKEFWKQLE